MTHSLTQLPKVSGIELWRGPSNFDGSEIVAIAILRSENMKTGNMIQTFILRIGTVPTEAVKNGEDAAICGDCPHRRTEDGKRSCYVNVGQSVNSVYRSFLKGNYPKVSEDSWGKLVKGRKVRLGAYGDPAMVPAPVWEKFIANSAGHTGYTHQWKKTSESFKHLCMASVDSMEEAREAWSAGWRTFRVRGASEVKQSGEVSCPASKEAGFKTTCENCGLCAGSMAAKPNVCKGIVIQKH